MIDWGRLTLLLYILMRMSGFVLFNPLLGRQNVPGIYRAGFALVLTWFVASFTGGGVPVPVNLVEFSVKLLLELGVGLDVYKRQRHSRARESSGRFRKKRTVADLAPALRQR